MNVSLYYLMPLSAPTQQFIRTFLETYGPTYPQDQLVDLLLKAHRYPTVDMPAAVAQLSALSKARTKLPSWYDCPNVCYPSLLSLEQCSGEWAARYKAACIVPTLPSSCGRYGDLTGGLGVDAYWVRRSWVTHERLTHERLTYVEANGELCAYARENFAALGVGDIEVVQDTAEAFLERQEADSFSVLYLDPSRRSEGQRVYDLAQCAPNVVALQDLLLEVAPVVWVKISPMADLSRTLELLPHTTQVHVVCVQNECKELLCKMEREVPHAPVRHSWVTHECLTHECLTPQVGRVQIVCVDLNSKGNRCTFAYWWDEEATARAQGGEVGGRPRAGEVLLEPHAGVMKAGAFYVVAERYGLRKLHVNSHLYVAKAPVEGFPGRQFQVQQVWEASKAGYKALAKEVPQGLITTRNFPLQAPELRARCGIKDGGNHFIFATTAKERNKDVKLLIQTIKLSQL